MGNVYSRRGKDRPLAFRADELKAGGTWLVYLTMTKGKGKAMPPELAADERPCPRCAGSGHWVEKHERCFRCNGTGKIKDKRKGKDNGPSIFDETGP